MLTRDAHARLSVLTFEALTFASVLKRRPE
jgi:hypothetical protein